LKQSASSVRAARNFSPAEGKLKQDILRIRREVSREAAYEELCEEEVCRDLAGKFARESATKTRDAIGEVRDRYDTIVIELIAARYAQTDGKSCSLGTVLRAKYESDSALNEFLPKFAKWIGYYVSGCIREHTIGFTPLYQQIVPTHNWTLCGHNVSRELLTALAEEYVRDREGLLRFLCTVFKRWRKIAQSHSAWRVKLVTEQHANQVHTIGLHIGLKILMPFQRELLSRERVLIVSYVRELKRSVLVIGRLLGNAEPVTKTAEHTRKLSPLWWRRLLTTLDVVIFCRLDKTFEQQTDSR